MNAVTIWLGIPFVIAFLAFALRRYPDLAYPLVILTCISMIGLSLFVTVGEPFSLGNSTVVINSSMVIGGRLISIDAESMKIVNFVYFINILWMIVGWQLRPNRFLPGLGLIIIVLLLSGLFIEPSFYAGFLFLIVSFLFVPLWVKAGSIPNRSIFRFLVMMFFGMPFFFLAGWQFSKLQIGLDNQQNLLLGGIFLSLGVVAFLSAFPMHSWIPMISADSHPMILSFFMTTFPFIVIRFFMIQIINNNLMDILGNQFRLVWLIVAIITLLLGAYGMSISKLMTRFLAYYLIFGVGIALIGMSTFDIEIWRNIEIWWFGLVLNLVVFLVTMKNFHGNILEDKEFNETESYNNVVVFLGMIPLLILPFTISFIGFIGILKNISNFVTWASILMVVSLFGVYIFMGKYITKYIQKIDWSRVKFSYSEDDPESSEQILRNRWTIFGFGIYFLIQIIFGLFPSLLVSIGIG